MGIVRLCFFTQERVSGDRRKTDAPPNPCLSPSARVFHHYVIFGQRTLSVNPGYSSTSYIEVPILLNGGGNDDDDAICPQEIQEYIGLNILMTLYHTPKKNHCN
jgi:hypothetical protein